MFIVFMEMEHSSLITPHAKYTLLAAESEIISKLTVKLEDAKRNITQS